jgi:hypothetical protein
VLAGLGFSDDLFAGQAPTDVVLLHGLDLLALDTAHPERGCVSRVLDPGPGGRV